MFCPGGLRGATARVQNAVSGSYRDAVFELVAHEESELAKSTT